MEVPSEISNNLVENSAVSPGILEEILPTTTTQTTSATDSIPLKDSLNSSNLNEIPANLTLLVNEYGLLLPKNIIPSPNNLSDNQTNTLNKDPLTGTTETESNIDAIVNNQKDPLINPTGKGEDNSSNTLTTTSNQNSLTIQKPATKNEIKLPLTPTPTTLKTSNPSQITKTLNLNEENIKGGYFTVEETAIIKIDYLFDGGFYQGELAIFSLAGLENSNLTIEQFILEAARRALSNTEQGYIVISDTTEGARFNGIIPGEKDWNTGLYKGEKSLKMQSGDKFAFMLVPNGTVQQIFENPKLGGAIRPLFSLATANPSEAFHLGQIAGINGNTFVIEDRRIDKDSDRDYNDIIFQVTGATGTVIQIDELINPQKEWRQTTIGQQILDYINTPPTLEDKEAPKIEAFLLNDTGTFNTDKITFDPTLKGIVTDNNKVTTFFAGFSENDISFDLTSNLTENGEFTLNNQQLATINGGELPDGNYTLYLQAGDSQNNLSEITQISFILDTTPPQITLKLDPTQDTGIPDDSSTELEIVNLVGKTEPNLTITLKETGKTTTADENGIFQFTEIQLQENENIFTIETTDLAGNQNQTTTTITRIPPAVPSLTLIEETSFKVTEEITLTIPETPSILNISLADIYFDKTDTDSINDSLELVLIDEKGNSLVPTIKPEKEAFFNWTEGETPLMGAGTTYSPQNQTISVNLTGLTPNTETKLIIRLINNDSDTTTTVSIKEISLKPAPQDAQASIQATTQTPSENTGIPLAEFNELEDISASIFPNYYTTTFNNKTSTIYADLALQNQGIYNINSPLLVGVTNISDPTVIVRNADGVTPEGIPYYNFSHLEKDGKLEAGETTEIGSLIFYNPNAVQFSYDLIIFAQINQNPIITTLPEKEIIIGKTYQYDINAIDPNNDTLSYQLLVAPQGMKIDTQTGQISWETLPENTVIGNHNIKIEVSDGRGGYAEQDYIISVIGTPPNRPPIFTSTPVVDAFINQPYYYDANAKDADQDNLTYSLILGPEGMEIDPETGEVKWTPPAVLMLGDTVVGRINLPGEKDEFTFSGNAGQRLYFDTLQYSGSSGDWKLEISSPSGSEFIDSNLVANQIFTLKETGNYRIVIDKNGDTTGTYGFSLIDLGMVPEVPFDTTINGTLSPGTEDDVFRFTGNAGQKLFFDKKSNNGNLDWILYDVDNESKSIDYYFNDMEIYLPQDGEYILALRGNGTLTSSTNYSFEIITPDDITTPITLGSNNNPNTIEGEITEKGETDFYSFIGTIGQRIYLDRLFQNPTNPWSFTATLITPDSKEITIHELEYSTDPTPIILNENGTYQIKIDARYENTGSYSFNLLDFDLATPINLDTTIQNTLTPGQETHLYKIVGTEGQRLYFDTTGGTSNTSWMLYNSANNLIPDLNNYLFNDYNQDLEIVLPRTDTYTLAIKGNNGNSAVDYSFKVITPDILTNQLTLGTPNKSNISEKGEQDIYTFNGTKGQRLFLDNLTDGANIVATLVSPNGTQVFNAVSLEAGMDYWRLPVILPEAGNYQLIIDGLAENTGSYSFNLKDVSAAPSLPVETFVTGTLTSGTSTQFYQFQGLQGERIYFDSQSNSPNTSWRLIEPNNEKIYDISINSDFEYLLPEKGTYYLMLNGQNNTPVDYNIQRIVTQVTNEPIEFNETINGEITKLGEKDSYTFLGTAGQQIYFDAKSGNTNISYEIFNTSDTSIVSGNTGTTVTAFPLTETGTYKIIVDGKNDATGGYSFSLTPTTIPINQIPRESLGNLTLGTTQNISLNAGEIKTYKFTGNIGQKIWIDGLNNPYSNIYLQLYSPNGEHLINNLDLSSDKQFTKLEEAGDYYLVLENYNNFNSTTSFRLLDTTNAETLALNTEISGNFNTTRETNLYKFIGSEGERLYFDTTRGEYYNFYNLYQPDGQLLLSQWLGNDGETVLPSNGEYFLSVSGNGSANTSYGIQIIKSQDTSTPLSIGDTVQGSVTLKGQQNIYTFEGKENQKIWFDNLKQTSNLTVRLISPTGREVVSNFDINSEPEIPAFTETGTYRLIIDANQNNTGEYSFRLLDFADASPVLLDTSITGNFGETKRETKIYKFTGTKDQLLYFNAINGDYSNYYRLYDTTGKLLFYQGLYWDTEASKLSGDGEYTLVLSGNNGANNNYNLQIVTPEQEIKNLNLGESIKGEIKEAGEQDIYTFTGTAGQFLWFDNLLRSNNISGTLYAPSGNVTWLTYDINYDSQPIVINESGKYTLKLDAYTDNLGAYEFRMLDFANATEAKLDTLITGNFGENKRETDIYKISAKQGQILYFDRNEIDYYNPYSLYTSNGKKLLDNLGTDYKGTQSLIPSDGEYILVFSGSEYGYNNNYAFQVITPDLISTPYSIGNSIEGEIKEKGEQDIYTFFGIPGQKILLDNLGTPTSNLTVKLIDPNGNNVFSLPSIDDNKPVTLSKEGTYSLIIDGVLDTVNTPYNLRLLDLENASILPLNTAITENFGEAGQETKLYKLNGNKGDYLYFDASAIDYYNSYSLYDQFGKEIFSQNLSYDYELALPQTGEYTLALFGKNKTNNNYELKVVKPEFISTPLTLGNKVEGEISLAGEKDTYTFNGIVGQQLFLDGKEGSNLNALLYAPSGEQVFNRSLSYDGPTFTLKETGLYRLVIDGDNNNINKYSFTLSDTSQIAPISLNTTFTGTTPSNEVSLYQFTGTQGQILNFNLDTTTWNGQNWIIYSPNNQPLTSGWLSGDFQATLPSSGLYTLAINNNNTTTSDYSFNVTDKTPPTITHSGFGTINGTLLPQTTVDHKFTANVGTQIILDSINNTNWEVVVKLTTPDNQEFFRNFSTTNSPVLVLPQTGEYTLQMYGLYPTSTGNYQFNLIEIPKSLRTPGTNYLELGGVVSGSINGTETKVYTFDGVEGLRLAFNGITGNNISATLIDPNGKTVVSKSNFQYFDIEPFTLSQNGLYHLLIEGEQTSSRDYSFQLLEVSTAPELTFNLPISGSLTQGTQSQFYKFNGIAGERLYFDSLNNSYYNNNWKLYGPNNLLLADSSRNLSQDFELELPQTGEYALLIEGGTIPSPVNYSFRVFSYDKDNSTSIITPGLGEESNKGLINLFPVKLGVEDGKGGKDIQDYNIRVWPDPENSNPVITSTPVTQIGINQPIYRYQLASIDPDNDVVSYQLIEGPTGSLIDANTGELLWTPEQKIQGQNIPFTVKVADGKGGEDVQTFTVEITSPLGKIQGAVFDDLNGNGFRDSKLIKGDDPAIVLAIDVSGSTAAPFIGPDGVDNVLEAQVAATKALVNSIIAQGLGDKLKIGLIPHNASAVIEDMDPITPGVQPYTTANADKDGNGVFDIYQILDSYQPIGSNDFTKTLQTIENLVSVLPGDPNVIFMSDGYGHLDENIAHTVVSNLQSQGIGITAFGIGQYSTLETLQKIDSSAIQLTDVQELVDIFAGWDSRYAIEPFLENVSVYLDSNNNGQLDEGEPVQLTKKDESTSFLGKNNYYYNFDNLSSGNYNVRVVVPNDAKITAPTFETFVDKITNKGESFTHLFGLHFGPDELPNADPSFLTTPPKYVLKAGESLVYKAFALDPEASPLTYSLITHPEGMSVDEKTGTVVWSPSAQQIDNYYTELKAEQNRLAAIGREEYAPKQVTFNVLLRATDTSGGQALQYIDVTLLPENNPPVFTSIFPENLSPQVGKLFQYQAKAIDADGDTIQYSIVSGLPTNAQFNTQTGLFQWTPTSNQLGAVELKIKATDSQGGETLQTIQTSVINALPNTVPVINSTPRTNAKVGNLYLYQLPTTDADGDVLQFNLKTAPTGLTIDNQGMLSWTPQLSQIGYNTIEVEINDGYGGITVHSFSINVSNNAVNYAPEITSTPNTVTNLDRIYQYQLTGTDPDGDALFWSLDNVPNGMVIDAIRGVLSWQPSFSQIGEHTIAVRLTDSNGVYVGQEFSLKVNGINTPPSIISTPVTLASQNQDYRYQVVGKDPENDQLNFSLGLHPEGMSIDTTTGLIQWTPTPNQIGNHLVDVIVRDTQGETEHQNYTVVVETQKINHPPVISSTPLFHANVDSVYRYEVIANDEDGDTLNYQLISAPAGMQINPQTGIIIWDNPIVGNYSVVVGVDDGSLGNAQSFSLTARVNNAPIINSTTPPATAIPGTVYAYDVVAVDPDGGKLKFSLDPVSVSKGMSLDEKGRLRWTPSLNDIGNHSIKISIKDENGGIVEQEFNLSVAADNILPKVSLITNYDLVNLGEELIIQALATDNIKVDYLQVFVNDVPVAIDSNGITKVSFNTVGDVTVKAIVKDSFGNSSETIKQVQVRDFSDVNSPVVSLNLPGGVVTAPVEIKGTVNDDSLLYYSLEVAPVNGGEFKEVFRGYGPVIDGVLGTFDPSVLANDSYILRLTAVDSGGNSSVTDDVIDVAGDLKLGNFQLSFTDLEIPVAGIPITVTRTYDSLNSNVSDEFGYGWRLEFRDTDLRTSVKLPSEEQQLMGVYNPFKDGTRVYITLPGGKRTGFTFKPLGDRLNSIMAVYGGDAARWYHPAFVADDGSLMTLSVEDVTLVKGAGTSEYYGLNGQPYNPADSLFGGKYKLTTSEGIVYEIDGKSGDLLSVTDTNGNQLTFSDAGIFSSSGKSVIFERDVTGRITAVVDPAGEKVVYEYDEKGDLVGVIDREENKTSFEYGDAKREHFLTDIIDPLGRTGVRTEYDESGRLKQLVDGNGSVVELVYDPDNFVQKVKDVFGKETTYVYDSRGNVITELDPLGKLIDRTYDEDNNVLTETVITHEINAAGNLIEVRSKTEWTYDSQGNKLSEKDAAGNVSRWTYNSRGQVLSETDALGNITTYTYSPSGNLLSTKDANGDITKFSYDAKGNLLSLTDAGNNITRFTYDAFGNVLFVEDANRNQTTFTYDSNGNRLTETRTVTTAKGTETLVTKSEYDSNGKVTKVTDAENKVTEYKYDASGNQIAVIDARNNKTEYRYDSKGQLVETIYPDNTPSNPADNPRTINLYDKGGRLRAYIDRNNQVTHYNYDDAGRLIETIYPDGEDTITQLVNDLAPNQTSATIDWTQVIYPDVSPAFLSNNSRSKTEYYKNGDVKAEIDELGNRTEYRYDLDSRLIEVIYPDDTPNNPADNPRTKTEYDDAGRSIATIDAFGRITRYEYDNWGRLVKTIYPDATPNNLLDNPVSKTEYDSLGRRISATDAAGKTVNYEYDALGRLTAVVQTLNQSETNPINLRTEYGYDEAGRLVWIEDAEENRTEFEYDKNGRRVAVELPLTQKSITTYDEVGNVQTVTDFNGDTITYSYDAENRLSSKQFSISGEFPVKFTYTPSGQIKTVVDARGTTAFNYDERGWLVSRIDPEGPYLASGPTIEYEYDDNGNRTEVRTPNGVTQYEYDEQNRLHKVTDSDNYVTIYSYDAVGNLERTEFPNGVVETRQYDEVNRLKFLEYQKDGVTLQSFDYSLDLVGHRRVVTELNDRRVEYEYDDLYRLTSETIFAPTGEVERTISYAYDAVGNRLTKTDSVGGVTIYTYDDNDRLLKEELRQNGVLVGSVEYGYDDNGNTRTRTKKDAAGNVEETVTYDWNQDNRLVGVQNSNGDVISYEYDADGVRVSQTVNGVTTEYLVDNNRDYAQVLEEWVNDALAASYVYGLDLISQERGNEDSFYLVDGLGSTRGLTNADGVVTDTYNYDAFGNLIGVFGGTENDYLFGGEQFDENLDQYYLRQRYYDPLTGRFSRRDTFEGYKTKPISLHDYVYADANPLSFIDPSGLVSINEFIVSNNIQNVLMTSFRIGNYFLNVLDKVNTTVSFIQDIQTLFNLASNPSSLYPALNTINFTGLPDLKEAIISLQANVPRIMSSILTNKIPSELAAFKKFFASNQSAYAFYPPDIFPKGISIPTGLKIKGRNVMIVTNNKADRLFGMGMLLKPGKDISLQFFRMDYGAFNHTPGGDSKNHDVWQDGNFHYHVPKN